MTDEVKTGDFVMKDVVQNKGAVAVSLFLNNSIWICFVNAHLNHGEEGNKFVRRNQNYTTIMQHMKFDRASGGPTKILEHDLVFWMGDLNFRLDYDEEFMKNEEEREKVILRCKQ